MPDCHFSVTPDEWIYRFSSDSTISDQNIIHSAFHRLPNKKGPVGINLTGEGKENILNLFSYFYFALRQFSDQSLFEK